MRDLLRYYRAYWRNARRERVRQLRRFTVVDNICRRREERRRPVTPDDFVQRMKDVRVRVVVNRPRMTTAVGQSDWKG